MATTISWSSGNSTIFTNADYLNAGSPALVILGVGWVSIESDAFRDSGQSSGSTILETIEIANTVTSLSDFALRQCSVLHTVTFTATSTLLTMGSHVFASCALLANIVLPSTLTSIGNNCFAATSSLSTFVLPNSITTMGDGVFWNSGITTVTLPNTITSIGNHFLYIVHHYHQLQFLILLQVLVFGFLVVVHY